VGSSDFASALSAVGAGAQASASGASGLAGARFGPAGSLPSAASRADKAREQFEATLLNSFVSEMMPKEASSVYGEGYAGEMWKSLLAEKVSEEIAKSDTLGLGKSLFSGGQASALEKLETVSHKDSGQADTTLMSANALSLPAGAEADDGDFLFLRGKTL
jgi:hypothetical protein